MSGGGERRLRLVKVMSPPRAAVAPRPKSAARTQETGSTSCAIRASSASGYPAQLSGGQRQRVALARALARRAPSCLLLDEPFGALDAKVRRELRDALRTIHDQLGLTSIFVTHDREEAFALADRVAILAQGRIEQYDTPDAIQRAPASPFVADFLQ